MSRQLPSLRTVAFLELGSDRHVIEGVLAVFVDNLDALLTSSRS
jgi:hypothetical protein